MYEAINGNHEYGSMVIVGFGVCMLIILGIGGFACLKQS